LIERGLVATTNSGGAGKWRDEHSETLRGARVVILPYNDDPGRQHAQKVAQHLQGVAAEVRVLELRGLPEKGDVATGCLTDLAGPAKAAGKTTLTLAMIRAVVDGGEFLDRRTARSPVAFLTEQSRGTFRPALSRAHLTERDDLSILYAHKAATLSWPQVVAAAVEECLRIGAQLLVVDTLPALSRLRGDSENSAGEALRVLEPLQQAAGEHEISVLYTRHERKGGGPVGEAARGSSAFAGGADVLLSLRHPEGRYNHGVRHLQSLSRFEETHAARVDDRASGGQPVSRRQRPSDHGGRRRDPGCPARSLARERRERPDSRRTDPTLPKAVADYGTAQIG
jgi:hypothetical protein